MFRVVKDWQEGPTGQTIPPSIPIIAQYQDMEYPVGRILEYENDTLRRTSNEEQRAKEAIHSSTLHNLRRAAETHRQVRKFAQQRIRPGRKLIDVCTEIEEMNRFLISESGLNAGVAFPTGCSLNHVAAHYTPNNGDNTIIQ